MGKAVRVSERIPVAVGGNGVVTTVVWMCGRTETCKECHPHTCSNRGQEMLAGVLQQQKSK
jgi:Zn-dependent alcohol dehydrogenase